jgi:hypothetical protein
MYSASGNAKEAARHMNLRLRRKDKGHHHTDAFDTSWPRNSARKECLRVKRIWTRMELGINIQNCSSDKGGAMKREESQVTVPQRPLLCSQGLKPPWTHTRLS